MERLRVERRGGRRGEDGEVRGQRREGGEVVEVGGREWFGERGGE